MTAPLLTDGTVIADVIDAEPDPVPTDAALTNRATVSQMVAVYEHACATIRASFAAILDAEARIDAVFKLGDHYGTNIRASRSHHRETYDADHAIDVLRRELWGCIVERLELRRMMSIAQAKALDEQLAKGELPEITIESVHAFAAKYAAAIPDMVGEAVREVFDFLRPWRGEYKTNSLYEIGPKVILNYWIERAWSGSGFHVHYSRTQHVIALENVFSVLDGRGAITKTNRSVLADAIAASGKSGRGETEYFRFKCHKKGTLHLEFKRLDLLKRFNQIAGGMRLRPGEAA